MAFLFFLRDVTLLNNYADYVPAFCFQLSVTIRYTYSIFCRLQSILLPSHPRDYFVHLSSRYRVNFCLVHFPCASIDRSFHSFDGHQIDCHPTFFLLPAEAPFTVTCRLIVVFHSGIWCSAGDYGPDFALLPSTIAPCLPF